MFDTIHDSSSVKDSGDLASYLIPNFIFLGLMGISAVLVAYGKYTVLYNDTKIIFRGLLGKVIEINWKDIIKVSFSKVGLQFYISDKDNRIYVHKHLSGFNSFTEQLKSTVGSSLIQKALIDLEGTEGR